MLRCPGHLNPPARTFVSAATARGPHLPGLVCHMLRPPGALTSPASHAPFGTGTREPHAPARPASPLRINSDAAPLPVHRPDAEQRQLCKSRVLELAAGAGRVHHTRSPSTRAILQPLERGPGLRRALRPGPSSSTTSLVYPSSPPKSSKHGLGTPRVKPFCCLPVGDDGVRFPWAAHAIPMPNPARDAY